jgi:hypothetical protein
MDSKPIDTAAEGLVNHKREERLERADRSVDVAGPWRVKPHGRDRHEIGPAGSGRRKALRACETLRRQRNPRNGRPWE